MRETYFRPIAQTDTNRPKDHLSLAGGNIWFSTVEAISRDSGSEIVSTKDLPEDVKDALTRPRADLCGLDLARSRIMGILNVTPDSFSDGGEFQSQSQAVRRAEKIVLEGADILDVGGESTRPGADFVPTDDEVKRTSPVISDLKHLNAPISIDTRKAGVASAAIRSGASIFNDVSALSFDVESLATASELSVPVCLMHASGDPKTMQSKPNYDDVLLDVYDYLEARRDAAIGAGVLPDHIIVDPGIGFGKTIDHNLKLLRGLSIFHGLGCPILLGASRKTFIGTLTETEEASARMPGSVAIALEAVRQGVQIIRVHDVAETKQAITLWSHLHY